MFRCKQKYGAFSVRAPRPWFVWIFYLISWMSYIWHVKHFVTCIERCYTNKVLLSLLSWGFDFYKMIQGSTHDFSTLELVVIATLTDDPLCQTLFEFIQFFFVLPLWEQVYGAFGTCASSRKPLLHSTGITDSTMAGTDGGTGIKPQTACSKAEPQRASCVIISQENSERRLSEGWRGIKGWIRWAASGFMWT